MATFISSHNELFDINTVEEFLQNKNIKYIKNDNEFFKKIIINNEDTVTLTSGIKNTKGKNVFFYFKNTNTVLHISNSYSWCGRGEPYKTFNSLKFYHFNDKLNILKNNLENNKESLLEIYKTINMFFNIKINNVKKYDNYTQFKEENYESLQKLIKKEFDNKVFVFDNFNFINRYKKLENNNKININVKIDEKSENLYNMDGIFNLITKNIIKKINLKLNEKINYLNQEEIIELFGNELFIYETDKLTIRDCDKGFTLIEIFGKNIKGVEKVFETIEKNIYNDKTFIVSLSNNVLTIEEDNIVSLNNVFDLYDDVKVTKEQAEAIKNFINKTLKH